MGCFDRIFFISVKLSVLPVFFKGSDNTYIQVCLSRIFFRVLIRSDRKMLVGLKYTRAIFLIVVQSIFSRFCHFVCFGKSGIFTCTQIDLRVVLYYHVEFA